MIKQLLFTVFLFSFTSTFSQYTYLPDNNFEQHLISKGYDNVLDNYVWTPNIRAIKTLDLSSKNINDLTGLEQFTALESLNISNNNITNVDFEKLVHIKSLICSNNRIKNFDLKENLALETLKIDNNPNPYLYLHENTRLKIFSALGVELSNKRFDRQLLLEELYLDSKEITYVDLTKNTRLHTLFIQNTKIISLDLSNNTALKNLTSKSNANLLCIKVVNAESAITKANFSIDDHSQFAKDCTGLSLIDNITGIQEITNDNGTLYYHDLTAGTDYWLNDPDKQDFTQYPFLLPESRILANTAGNNIESVKFSIFNSGWDGQYQYPTEIIDNEPPYTIEYSEEGRHWVSVTPYSEDDAQGIEGDTYNNNFVIITDYREFSDTLNILSFSDQSKLIEVVKGQANSFNIKKVKGETIFFEALVGKGAHPAPFNYEITGPNISASGNYKSSWFGTEYGATSGIELEVGTYTIDLTLWFSDAFLRPGNPKIYTFTVTDSEEPKTYVPDDNFEQALIDLGYDDVLNDYVLSESITSITELALLGKGIQDITGLQDFAALKTLIVADNPISQIDVSQNKELEVLLMGGANSTTLDVSKNTKLIELDVNGNELTELDVSNNLSLKRLELADNKISGIDVSANSLLERLNIFNTPISGLDLKKNLKLNSLNASSTQLTALDVSNNGSLDTLNTDDNSQLSCIRVSENQLNAIPTDWSKDNSTSYATDCSVTFSGEITQLQEITNDNGTFYYHDLSNAAFNKLYWLNDPEQQDFTQYPFLLPGSQITVQTEGENIESVEFRIWNADWCCTDQPTSRVIIDNEPPYIIDTFEVGFDDGPIEIQATPYSQDNGKGISGDTERVVLRILYDYREFKDILNIRNLADGSIVYEVGEGQNNSFDLNLNEGQTVYFEPQNKNGETAGSPFKYTITGPNKNEERDLFGFGVVMPFPDGLRLEEGVYTINLNWRYSDAWTIPGIDKEFSFTVTSSDEPKTYVPDNNFEQALIDLGYDDVLNDYVLSESITSITELALLGKGIQELKGIQDFVALKSLDLADNPIHEIDISANTQLQILLLGNTAISELDVSKNSTLLELDVNGTRITALDVSNNPKLERLEIADSNIDTIDIAANGSLEKLNIFNTAISTLYLEENPVLNYLNASSTPVMALDVSKNAALTTLIVNNNPQLGCIKVSENQLNEILQNWTKDGAAQYSLDCSSTSNEGARTFIPDNNFEQALIALGYDDVLDDYVLTKSIAEVKELHLLGKGIQNMTGLQDFAALTFLDAADNPITQINVIANTQLEILLLGATEITGLNVSKNYALRELDLNGTPITALNISKNLDLERLEIADGRIVAIDVSANTALTKVNIFNTAIARLDLENNPLLNSLNVSASQLTNLNVSNNHQLNTFDATNNPQLGCIQVSENQKNEVPENWIKDETLQYALDCSQIDAIDEEPESGDDDQGSLQEDVVSEEGEVVDTLTLFPTFTNGIITIQNNLEHEIGDISVRSLTGASAKYMVINSNPKEIEIDLRGKALGLYIVQIQRVSGDVDLIKIMLY